MKDFNIKKFISEGRIHYNEKGKINYESLDEGFDEEEQGLIVIGSTQSDNDLISGALEDSAFFGEWNSIENYWFFPEKMENYDALEGDLSQLFDSLDISVRFEGVFNNDGDTQEREYEEDFDTYDDYDDQGEINYESLKENEDDDPIVVSTEDGTFNLTKSEMDRLHKGEIVTKGNSTISFIDAKNRREMGQGSLFDKISEDGLRDLDEEYERIDISDLEKEYYSPSDSYEYWDGEYFYNRMGNKLRNPSEYRRDSEGYTPFGDE